MAATAIATDSFRALSRLEGIMRGIVADEIINEGELSALLLWLEAHHNLIDICPFSDAYQVAWQASKDRNIDAQTWQELVDYCHTIASDAVDLMTKDIRILHGYLQGILADNIINVDELKQLSDWLATHGAVKEKWPFNQVIKQVSSVLADGRISEQEHHQLQHFFADFTEQFVDGYVPDYGIQNHRPWTITESPVVETIEHICERNIRIKIHGCSFCFTGQMRGGKRADIHKHLIEIGGIPKDNVVKDLHYLVIGANSNPCWAYSTYGRKIEKVMESNRSGCNIIILHEDDYLVASQFPKWYAR